MNWAIGNRLVLLVSAIWFGLAAPVSAATLFDNTGLLQDMSTRFDPGTDEVGDGLVLAGIGNLTYFSFEYWGSNSVTPSTFSGAIEAKVRFYYNNGADFNGYASPGFKFYESDWFSIPSPTERNTVVFTDTSDFGPGGLAITDPNITWSVQFEGMGANDTVGLDLYNPPLTGQDYPDYWDANGGWKLMTNDVPVNFGALMLTPEPSSMTLALLGGVSLLIAMRRFRQTE